MVDDGSRDGTADLVRELSRDWPALRLESLERNSGKGAAVRAGFAVARGECVAYADADLSAPIDQIAALLADLGDSDVALVSRALPGARLLRRQSVVRETAGKLYALVAQALLLRGVPDAHCGLKIYRGELGRAIFRRVREDGILFDIEALLLAALRGARISQRPAVWSHEPNSRIRFNVVRAFRIGGALLRLKLRYRLLLPVRAQGPIRESVAQSLPYRQAIPGTSGEA